MSLLRVLLLLVVALPARADDAAVLSAAKVGVDGPALLDWFRARTLSPADRQALAEHIRNLGSRSFSVRERAHEAILKRGGSAIPYLKSALESRDLEIVRRAERCLTEIERGPGSELTMAAVRLLASKEPDKAVGVLVAFVPHADDENVEELVLETLVKLSPISGKADPALVAALTDDRSTMRAAGAYVLGRFSAPALRAEVRKLLADTSHVVRFRAAQGLLLGQDRAAVPTLFALLSDAPLALAWQIEELLTRLAGENSPTVSVGSGTPAARTASRAAWEKWWSKAADKVDLSQVEDVRRLLGMTLIVEYNTKRIWECGPEGVARWQFSDIEAPMDAWVLPGHRVLVAVGEGVSERDLTGKVLRRFEGTAGATSCQRLANGHTFVSTVRTVMEFDRDGKKLYQHDIGSSNAIRKRRGGTIIYTTPTHIIEMDTAGKQVRTIPLPRHEMWIGLEEIEGDRFLVANSVTGRVLEVDAEGKIVWEAQVAGACGLARLPTGTTLVGTNQRVVELDRKGAIVWERKTSGYARRVHRR